MAGFIIFKFRKRHYSLKRLSKEYFMFHKQQKEFLCSFCLYVLMFPLIRKAEK